VWAGARQMLARDERKRGGLTVALWDLSVRCPETVDTWLMASANLDLVRSFHAAWERGDFSSDEWAHPEIEFVIAGGPTPGSWTGLDGMAEGWRDFLSAWEEFRIEVDEYRELDDERVLVLVHFSARGKTSGLELEQMRAKGAELFHVHGGKVTRNVAYWDRERAFADVGLAPDAGTPRS
jgi:ketosteroid isomerase-like protein